MKQMNKGLLFAATLLIGGQSACSDTARFFTGWNWSSFRFPSWTQSDSAKTCALTAATGTIVGMGIGGTAVWAFMKRSAQKQKARAQQESLSQQPQTILPAETPAAPKPTKPSNKLTLNALFATVAKATPCGIKQEIFIRDKTVQPTNAYVQQKNGVLHIVPFGNPLDDGKPAVAIHVYNDASYFDQQGRLNKCKTRTHGLTDPSKEIFGIADAAKIGIWKA